MGRKKGMTPKRLAEQLRKVRKPSKLPVQQEVKTMQVYRCVRCGELHDFATQAQGRLCDNCGAPLAYHGQELSPWGEHPMRDYDMTV